MPDELKPQPIEERYFQMDVRHLDQWYMVRVESAEGQPNEFLAAIKEVVDAAKKLAAVVGAIDFPDYPEENGITMVLHNWEKPDAD